MRMRQRARYRRTCRDAGFFGCIDSSQPGDIDPTPDLDLTVNYSDYSPL